MEREELLAAISMHPLHPNIKVMKTQDTRLSPAEQSVCTRARTHTHTNKPDELSEF